MLSLYIHWPFCKKKCPYCDYNTYAQQTLDETQWRLAYDKALQTLFERTGKQALSSIFFGGGTPSLMPIAVLERILNKIAQHYSFSDSIEITLETNPTKPETIAFQDFKRAGINRLSIGVQALNDKDLQWLGRQHSAKDALLAIEETAKLFDRWSVDLMYGRPDLSATLWQQEIEAVLKMGAKHLSCYQLTVMEQTPFHRYQQRGDFQLPNDDAILAVEEVTRSLTQRYDLEHYEISSYGASGHRCKHNEHYWQYNSYAGIGAGSHGRVHVGGDIIATTQCNSPAKWLNQAAYFQETVLSKDDIIAEYVLSALRYKPGINIDEFENRTGKPITVLNTADLLKEGYIQQTDTNLYAISKGWQFLNYVERTLLP